MCAMGVSPTKVDVTRSQSVRERRSNRDFRIYLLVAAFAAFACAVIVWKELGRHATPPEPSAGTSAAAPTDQNPPDLPELTQGSSSRITVIRVIDADTFNAIGRDNIQFTVRLARIDAPELGQQYGWEAKDRLEKMILHRQVTLQHTTRGKYGRVVAEVFESDAPVDVPLVREGLAWVEPSASAQAELMDLEREARQARRGLWAGENPVEPWVWRQRRGM